jgi:hypothetical protein
MNEGEESCAEGEVGGALRMGFEPLAVPGRVLAAPGAPRCWPRWRRRDRSWLVAVGEAVSICIYWVRKESGKDQLTLK